MSGTIWGDHVSGSTTGAFLANLRSRLTRVEARYLGSSSIRLRVRVLIGFRHFRLLVNLRFLSGDPWGQRRRDRNRRQQSPPSHGDCSGSGWVGPGSCNFVGFGPPALGELLLDHPQPCLGLPVRVRRSIMSQYTRAPALGVGLASCSSATSVAISSPA